MDLSPFVDELQEHLAAAATTGGDDVQEAARRLTGALDAATRLVLLDALSTAAGEISQELLPGSVDVRLRGRDPEFVVERPVAPSVETPAAPAPPSETAAADEGPASRTTLRLPDGLKARIEAAAARDGSSLNSWIVRALAAAVDAPPRAAPAPAPNPAGRSSSFSGWVR